METKNDDPLVLNKQHAAESHNRWIELKNRHWPEREEEIPDVWTIEQCGGCCYYIPLSGTLGSDWGVCSNVASQFDGRVMFEHDGCDEYAGAYEWVGTFLANSKNR